MDKERSVALLRAVNVGGTAGIAMTDLKAAAATAGLTDLSSILQSGNLVFRAAGPPDIAGRRLEAALLARFDLVTTVLVRTRVEWATLVAANPFDQAVVTDPSRCLAMVLDREPETAGAGDSLRELCRDGERVALRGSTLFLHYPNGIGRSKLTTAAIERRLGVRGTARNWTTVSRIASALDAG